MIVQERLTDLESDLARLLPLAVPVTVAAGEERKVLDLRTKSDLGAQ